jgi:murein DD-endopeptidase MepM/ murein hydrolase activator NlpD
MPLPAVQRRPSRWPTLPPWRGKALLALVALLLGAGPASAEVAPASAAARAPERTRAVTRAVARNQGPAQVLAALGFPTAESLPVLAALQEHLSFTKVRPGDQVRVERAEADGALRSLSWRRGPGDEILVRPCPAGLCAERRASVTTREVVRVEVTLRSSVYEALRAGGQDPALAAAAADVLAWDVDFYQDVRPGDALRIVVERVEVDGRFLRYGDVLAAEYEGRVAGRKRLFRYADPEGHVGYFDDAGQSAQRGFLRAPVPFVHVTSRFGRRNHPLLQYVRQHQGVDYGAPEGTPVWAVGDGTVAQAGWSGGCGLSVTVRHRNGFESLYCHLSKVHVSAGAHVAQKQVVGKVGHTGLATGAHLHYAVRRGGSFVNPLALHLPRGEPVRAEGLEDFLARIGPARAQLDARAVAMVD